MISNWRAQAILGRVPTVAAEGNEYVPDGQVFKPQLSSTPTQVHGPLTALVNGQWFQIPAFSYYGSASSGGPESGGVDTIYYDKNGNPVIDPLQQISLPGGTLISNMNPDGSLGSLYGSVSTGSAGGGGQFMQDYGGLLALSGLGAFAGAAAAGLGSAGAAGAAPLDVGTYGFQGAGLGDSALGATTGGITTAAPAAGTGNMSVFDDFLDPGTYGDSLGQADFSLPQGTWDPTASGDLLNANAGLSDYLKGALQSGNLDQITRLLPSLPPGTQTAIKALLGGGGSSAASSGGDSSLLDTLLKGLGTKGGLTALGALLGSTNGAKQAGTTTTVQDIPDWQKPYVIDLFNQAQTALKNSQANQTSNTNLVNAGNQQLTDTINGKYLDPNSNPYLSGMFNAAADQVQNRVNSDFESSGRYGSGAHTGELTYQLGNLANNFYGNAYQQGRQQQLTAATAAPGYAQSATQNAFAPLDAYSNIIRSPLGSSTSSPFFTNPAAGALSGALAGYGLSNAFGGNSRGQSSSS